MLYTIDPTLLSVTREQFFAAMGPDNVNPNTVVSTFREPEHVSEWHTLDWNRRLFGISVGSPPKTRFYLAPTFAQRVARK